MTSRLVAVTGPRSQSPYQPWTVKPVPARSDRRCSGSRKRSDPVSVSRSPPASGRYVPRSVTTSGAGHPSTCTSVSNSSPAVERTCPLVASGVQLSQARAAGLRVSNASRPPAARCRWKAASAALVSSSSSSTWNACPVMVTSSNVRPRRSVRASPVSHSTSSRFARATASMSGSGSTPTSSPRCPAARARLRIVPVPQPTSSTESAASISSR